MELEFTYLVKVDLDVVDGITAVALGGERELAGRPVRGLWKRGRPLRILRPFPACDALDLRTFGALVNPVLVVTENAGSVTFRLAGLPDAGR